MKTKSTLFRTTGILLAVLMLFALASPNALANCGQCADVDIIWEYGGSTGIYFELSVANPSGANIYYTTCLDSTPCVDPTWNTSTGAPTNGTLVCYSCATRDVPVDYGHTMTIRARAWKSCYYQSVNITSDDVHNPNK
jgi:hypothetical protein